LKSKYDGAVREKMIYKLEKDKLQNELNALKLNTSMPSLSKEILKIKKLKLISFFVDSTEGGLGPTQTKLRELRLKEEKKKVALTTEQRRLTGSNELPNESHPRVCNFFII
jgi:hypothetical protein